MLQDAFTFVGKDENKIKHDQEFCQTNQNQIENIQCIENYAVYSILHKTCHDKILLNDNF